MARTTKKEADSTSKSTKATKSAANTKTATTKASRSKSTDKSPSEAQPKNNKRSAAPRKEQPAKHSAEPGQPAKQPVATEADTAPRARRTPSRTNRVTVEPATHNPFVKTPSADEIAERAYFLFLERGAHHGCDVDDWLEAERQVTGTHG